ncbi:hypothetical protein [Malikia spinosa]|uniref:hypothetical protein n=1 Tax=Malikia spinosa TaxID=86180 RepID=UPI0027B900E5|nr:hypothetical protein [Malikia spinosa]
MENIICLSKISNREQLSALKLHKSLGVGVNVVYVYFLVNKIFPYPKGNSNILYIGEAMRESEPTGVRFRQHITPSNFEGSDMGNNFILSQYFHANWVIGLSIFGTNEERKDRERDLIYAHISLYGAPPIAQGKIPHDCNGRNRTYHISQFIKNNDGAISGASNILMDIVATHGAVSNLTGSTRSSA